MVKDKGFVTITNRQIYKELCDIKDDIDQFKEQNRKEHEAIMAEIASYKSQVTNLKVALGGIGILSMTILGFLFSHLVR